MSERTPVRVSPETLELLRGIAADRSIEIGDAADLAVKTANSRLKALANYAKKGGGARTPKPKKEKSPKEKKAKAAKKPKAKKAKAARSPKAKKARKARPSRPSKKASKSRQKVARKRLKQVDAAD